MISYWPKGRGKVEEYLRGVRRVFEGEPLLFLSCYLCFFEGA